MLNKYKVLHITNKYELDTEQNSLHAPLKLVSADIMVVNTSGNVLTYNVSAQGLHVNVDDEILIDRYDDGKLYIDNLTQKRKIIEFVKQNQR